MFRAGPSEHLFVRDQADFNTHGVFQLNLACGGRLGSIDSFQAGVVGLMQQSADHLFANAGEKICFPRDRPGLAPYVHRGQTNANQLSHLSNYRDDDSAPNSIG
jgi:hypothetical protein